MSLSPIYIEDNLVSVVSILSITIFTHSLPLSPHSSVLYLQDCGGRGQEADSWPVWRLSTALQKPQCRHHNKQHGEHSHRAFFTYVLGDFITSALLCHSQFTLGITHASPYAFSVTTFHCLPFKSYVPINTFYWDGTAQIKHSAYRNDLMQNIFSPWNTNTIWATNTILITDNCTC